MNEPVNMQGWASERVLRRWAELEEQMAAWAAREHGPAGELAVRAVYLARLNGFLGRLPRISDTAFDRYMQQIRAGDVRSVFDDLERCELLPELPEHWPPHMVPPAG
jgi:hypothetical protein